jgi:hypothetical protein
MTASAEDHTTVVAATVIRVGAQDWAPAYVVALLASGGRRELRCLQLGDGPAPAPGDVVRTGPARGSLSSAGDVAGASRGQ